METRLEVDNLKCGGCASSIEDTLLKIKDVQRVIVNVESDEVVIHHVDNCDIDLVKNELHRLGYPEKGTSHGLNKVASNVKSYVSCAIGRLHKSNNTKKTDHENINK